MATVLDMIDDRNEIFNCLSRDFNERQDYSHLPGGANFNVLMQNATNDLAKSNFVLWRPDIFEAATYRHDDLAKQVIPIQYIPAEPQLWAIEGRELPKNWKDVGNLRNKPSNSPLGYILIGSTVRMLDIEKEGQDIPRGYVIYLMRNKSAKDWFVHCELLYSNPGIAEYQDNFIPTAVMAGLTFLQSGLTGYSGVHLRRPDMRRLTRYGNKHIPLVQRIILRESQSRVKGDPQTDGREYDHCWNVRAHWRMLPKPRKSDGATFCYVNPYLKGDPDKPLMPVRDMLYHVKR